MTCWGSPAYPSRLGAAGPIGSGSPGGFTARWPTWPAPTGWPVGRTRPRSCPAFALSSASRSTITLGTPPPETTDPSRGRISNYAWGRDYHDWMGPASGGTGCPPPRRNGWRRPLPGLCRYWPNPGAGPRGQAGLGFIGKNTCLIHPRIGSWLFWGRFWWTQTFRSRGRRFRLMWDMHPLPGRLSHRGAGSPYVLDARRCISYLTIECRGEIPPDLRARMGNWIYGCDICREVCPWNRFARRTSVTDFLPPSLDRIAPLRKALLALDEDSFQRQFGEPGGSGRAEAVAGADPSPSS